jgi:hypothetical protein
MARTHVSGRFARVVFFALVAGGVAGLLGSIFPPAALIGIALIFWLKGMLSNVYRDGVKRMAAHVILSVMYVAVASAVSILALAGLCALTPLPWCTRAAPAGLLAFHAGSAGAGMVAVLLSIALLWVLTTWTRTAATARGIVLTPLAGSVAIAMLHFVSPFLVIIGDIIIPFALVIQLFVMGGRSMQRRNVVLVVALAVFLVCTTALLTAGCQVAGISNRCTGPLVLGTIGVTAFLVIGSATAAWVVARPALSSHSRNPVQQ